MKENMEELLSQYLDEELDDETTEYVRQKLASDPEWQLALDELQITVQSIRELPSEATPERELWPEIVEAHGAAAPAVVAQEAKRRFWTMPRLLAAGLAACLVPAAGLGMASLLRAPEEPAVIAVAPEPESFAFDFDFERIAEQARRAAEQAIRARDRALRGRERALRGLERVERSRLQTNALEALITVLNDQDLEVRVQAVHALGEFESPQAIEALGRVLINDPVPEVQKMAAWALGEIESAAAVDYLVRALRADSPEVRKQAAWALGEIESAAALDGLAAAIENENDPEVRRMLIRAISEIGN